MSQRYLLVTEGGAAGRAAGAVPGRGDAATRGVAPRKGRGAKGILWPVTPASWSAASTAGVTTLSANMWRTPRAVVTTLARAPYLFVTSTGLVVKKTRTARSPTPLMIPVPASNCSTDIIMFCPLS